jgi:hypothetical protein
MLEVFFDAQGLVWYGFIPEGCAVNKEMCIGIHDNFRDAVKKKERKVWKSGHKTVGFFCTRTHLHISHW